MAKPAVSEATYDVRVLIMGCGNTLRGDDGLGPYIVDRIAQRRLPGIQTRIEHQLTPELVDDLARVDLAIFVDAVVAADEGVRVRAVTARRAAGAINHVADAEAILDLTRVMHGRAPCTWLVSVPGVSFAYEEGLSPSAQVHAELALRRIEELIACTNSV